MCFCHLGCFYICSCSFVFYVDGRFLYGGSSFAEEYYTILTDASGLEAVASHLALVNRFSWECPKVTAVCGALTATLFWGGQSPFRFLSLSREELQVGSHGILFALLSCGEKCVTLLRVRGEGRFWRPRWRQLHTQCVWVTCGFTAACPVLTLPVVLLILKKLKVFCFSFYSPWWLFPKWLCPYCIYQGRLNITANTSLTGLLWSQIKLVSYCIDTCQIFRYFLLSLISIKLISLIHFFNCSATECVLSSLLEFQVFACAVWSYFL